MYYTPLTVVMPAYNEQACIEDSVQEVIIKILNHVKCAELIVVDDGSKDNTGRLLDAIAVKQNRVKVIHQTNAGHGAALMRGMDEAEGEYILLIDSDGEVALESFAELWQTKGSIDAILGYRRLRRDARLRRFITRGLRWILKTFWKVPIQDANAPFKLIRRSIWQDAADLIDKSSTIPSILLAFFLVKKGYSYKEVAIEHRGRHTGTVSIKRWKLIKYCWGALKDLIRFSRLLHQKNS